MELSLEQQNLAAQRQVNPREITPGQTAKSGPHILRALLWAEWFAHGKLLLGFIILWLLSVWLLPVFVHPGFVLLLGILYALVAGPIYGGSDVVQGCEEFSFALPATRSERYLTRLAVGCGALLLFTGLDLLALGLDLPQALARLYIDTGLIKPLPAIKPGLLYGLVWAFPFATFAFSFSVSATTHLRTLIFTAWFWSLLAALGLLQLGLFYEELVWEKTTGFFSCPLLLASGIAGLWLGYRRYVRKEVGFPAAPLVIPSGWWIWILLLLGGIALALTLISSLARHYPRIFY
jgi:hypothetical protein